ncbi:MAG: hypothetical protein Q7S40_03490 [Opitutaceae bacterium]|nr:hypothetical protein [Opitutaceae bacterium]
MAFDFPNFDKGDTDSLMDSKWAKKLKLFVDLFKKATVTVSINAASANKVAVTESNILITVNPASGPFELLPLTVCVNGVATQREFIVRRQDSPSN